MKTYKTLALATLLLTSLAGTSAWAQCKPYDLKIALEPTKLGEGLSAIATAGGHLDSDCSEMFGLTVSGKIADGEMLTVVVVSKAGTFQIGSITMFDSIGQLVLDSVQDVSDVFPINQLESIQVIQGSLIKARTKSSFRMEPPQVLLEGLF
jgi:hypothetical protein